MSDEYLNVKLRTSPHLKSPNTTQDILNHVLIALLPATLFGIWMYGLGSLILVLVTLTGGIFAEFLLYRKIQNTSTLITALILSLSLPPALPWWMGFVGGGVSALLGKGIFGGFGQNPFNPAMLGRVFLQTSFPSAMNHWANPLLDTSWWMIPDSNWVGIFKRIPVDAVSGATPLALAQETASANWQENFWRWGGGSLVEHSDSLVILGGLYLCYKSFVDWRIPLGVLLSASLTSLLLFVFFDAPHPIVSMSFGALLFGAFFVATDPVTSPVTARGVWAYAFFIGSLSLILRKFGSSAESFMYVILLANTLTPLLNRFLKTRVYGHLSHPNMKELPNKTGADL